MVYEKTHEKNIWSNSAVLYKAFRENEVVLSGCMSTEDTKSDTAPEIESVKRNLEEFRWIESNGTDYSKALINGKVYDITRYSFKHEITPHTDREDAGVSTFKAYYYIENERKPEIDDFDRITDKFTTNAKDVLGYRRWVSPELCETEIENNGYCEIYYRENKVYTFRKCAKTRA